MNYFFSLFFINTRRSATAQWMAIKCIPYGSIVGTVMIAHVLAMFGEVWFMHP